LADLTNTFSKVTPKKIVQHRFRRAQKQENTEGYYDISDTDRMTNVFGGVEPKESKLKIL
jgi:hypothetical protein